MIEGSLGEQNERKVCRKMLVKREESPRLVFENVSRDDWDDWRWQIRNSIKNISQLAGILHVPVSSLEEEYQRVIAAYPFSITPYYLSLIDLSDRQDPIRLQCFPDARELEYTRWSEEDPLREEQDMPVPDLIHRYPDRCLVMVTGTCATYCRHCNRKRRWKIADRCLSEDSLSRMIRYVSHTKQIREVILSGGDPLMMGGEMLEWLLRSFRSIPHVEVLRIGSRIPVVLPMKIDRDFCDMLRKYRPLWFNTQFNHPREITPDAAQACGMLLESGIPVVNQSVLLKGVNDTDEVMRELLYGLQRISVKPYYLFQCEPVKGAEHFIVHIERGIKMMEKLWGNISGVCLPRYVYDLPGGRGKMLLESRSLSL
jgi:lysine 2,3-aminomutase